MTLIDNLWVGDPPRIPHVHFMCGVPHFKQCPADVGKEVALSGYSNVGKSSVCNTLTGANQLARVAKQPGRTREINFFALDAAAQYRLVDLPGYGYARVSSAIQHKWRHELDLYFRKRQSLVGVILIMDIRQSLREWDKLMLEWAQATQVPVYGLLNKADKLSKNKALHALKNMSVQWQGADLLQLFSAHHKIGITQARAALARMLATKSVRTLS